MGNNCIRWKLHQGVFLFRGAHGTLEGPALKGHVHKNSPRIFIGTCFHFGIQSLIFTFPLYTFCVKHSNYLKHVAGAGEELSKPGRIFNYKLHFSEIASNRSVAVQVFSFRQGGA